MDRENEIWAKLRSIVDSDKEQDIVELGYVSHLKIKEGAVIFRLHLPAMDAQLRDQYQFFTEQVVKELPWVTSVTSILDKAPKSSSMELAFKGLNEVSHIIAVSSCKGGVGKSTVAVNLAMSLALDGHLVGLFDADIYGPSLPTMLGLSGPVKQTDAGLLSPAESHGVKVMSFGFTDGQYQSSPAVMRGPMVSQVVNQLISGTDWGVLDYLIVDMPPGTGDIQLTLTQMLPLSGAVVVTTPQKVSVDDVMKGIRMFQKLNVPILGIVENEQYFVCDGCDKRHFIFGPGYLETIQKEVASHFAIGMPLHPLLAECGDEGLPFVVKYPSHEVSQLYRQLSLEMVKAVTAESGEGSQYPMLLFEPGKGLELTKEAGLPPLLITPRDLRLKCQCAHCVNEFTGDALLKPETVAQDIEPLALKPIGRYAIGVSWSDGHSSIYPFSYLNFL
jgi:Mrp family chromosome partitioning ATPase